MIRTSPDVPILGELEEYLAQNLLFKQKNLDAGLADINQKPGFKTLIKKHGIKLFGGPVIGRVTPTSAVVWLRTPDSAEVKIVAQPGNITGTARTRRTIQRREIECCQHADAADIGHHSDILQGKNLIEEAFLHRRRLVE